MVCCLPAFSREKFFLMLSIIKNIYLFWNISRHSLLGLEEGRNPDVNRLSSILQRTVGSLWKVDGPQPTAGRETGASVPEIQRKEFCRQPVSLGRPPSPDGNHGLYQRIRFSPASDETLSRGLSQVMLRFLTYRNHRTITLCCFKLLSLWWCILQ